MAYLSVLVAIVEVTRNVRMSILLLITIQQRRTARMPSQGIERNILKLNEAYGFTMQNTIFNSNSPYGFLININNPRILPLYIRYKKRKNLALHFPISDEDRIEFETVIFKSLKKQKKNSLSPLASNEIS